MISKYIIFTGVGLLFFFHFFILAWHHLPENPIKHQFKYQISGYVNPLFSQQWTLFAPNPVSTNISINYKLKGYQDGKPADTTEWLDTNDPLIEFRRSNSFSAGQRLLKYLSSCCMDILKTRSETLEYISKVDSIKNDSMKIVQYVDQVYQACNGHLSLMEYSKHVAKKYYGSQYSSFDSIVAQYKILDGKFPRFSKRDLDYFNLENYEYSELVSTPFRVN